MLSTPPTLLGETIRVEPLRRDHADGFWRLAEPDLFTYLPMRPADWTRASFDDYLTERIEAPNECPFAIVLQETSQPVGITAYMDIRAAHCGLEIGSTIITAPYQGTRVNPECKLLLLRHAFENLGAIRVQLKTDSRNEQSQRAIAKLGAQREGILRHHMVLSDGYIRNTVMFSITDQEWPTIKAGLLQRLSTATT